MVLGRGGRVKAVYSVMVAGRSEMRSYLFTAARLVPDNGAWKPATSEAAARCVCMAAIVDLK